MRISDWSSDVCSSDLEVADGNGPVNALDTALRKALVPLYPQLEDMRLVDYKVRILTPQAGTRAVTRVMIESADASGRRWTTIGGSTNIIDARSEEHTSALQSLIRNSYAVFCLKKKRQHKTTQRQTNRDRH